METLWFGDVDGSFFNFDDISKQRKISYPMLPDELAIKVNEAKKIKILPKQTGEVRLLSVDLALMASTKNKNDASAIFVNQLTPTKAGRYLNNIIYAESSEGSHTQDQAERVRKLFDMYYCDYIVIDVRGVGIGVADALVRDIVDSNTGEVYPALSCCNDKVWEARCTTPGAQKALWVVNATDKFNSDCAIMMRDGFRSGRIRLPVTEYDGETLLSSIKGYASLDVETKLEMQMTYINTTLLINEMINLQHDESSGLIHIARKNSTRKDRYSSLSYSYYVACQLELSLSKKRNNQRTNDDFFLYRAPKIK